MSNLTTIQTRINRGVRWLDKKLGRKNWAKKIDLENLNLISNSTCVIGEIFGNYDKLCEIDRKVWEKDEEYGFNRVEGDDGDFKLLTKMWFATLIKLGIGIK